MYAGKQTLIGTFHETVANHCYTEPIQCYCDFCGLNVRIYIVAVGFHANVFITNNTHMSKPDTARVKSICLSISCGPSTKRAPTQPYCRTYWNLLDYNLHLVPSYLVLTNLLDYSMIHLFAGKTRLNTMYLYENTIVYDFHKQLED